MNIRHFLFLPLLSSALFAQNAEPVVSTEFLTIALDEPVSGLCYRNGESIARVDANLTGLGQPVSYKGPRLFVLRNNEAEFTAKPEPPPPVASVLLPAKADRVLIAFVKSADKPLRLAAYDISGTGSKAGDYRFFNFSGKTLSVNLESRKFVLESRQDQIVTSGPWREEVLDLPIQIASVENEKPKIVFSSIWGHRPGRRNFIFLFDGRHPSKPVGVCRFFDIPHKQQPAAP